MERCSLVICTYIRSSSAGCFEWCEHKYFLTYVLGFKDKSGWKAERGNMVHKALELLAHEKVAIQQGKTEFYEKECNLSFKVGELSVEDAAKIGFNLYKTKNESGRDWTETDFEDVLKWVKETVEFRDGIFDPRKRNILAPEQYFDIEIDRPWAKYCFEDPHTKQKFDGQLRIKGTIDLVTEIEPGVIEYCDWKTGLRRDWAKNKEKTYKCLCKDAQLMLYFYALNKLYPDAKMIFVSIFFIQDGGPYTICFEKRHLVDAENMLKKKFEAIKRTVRPKRIIGRPADKWKCTNLCEYYKNKQDGSDLNVCDFIHKELQQIGMDRVISKYGKPNAWGKYTDGGGQSSREA